MPQGVMTARERALQRAAEAAGGLPPLKRQEVETKTPEKKITIRNLRPGDIIASVPGLLRSPVVVKVEGFQLHYTTFTDRSRTRLSQNVRLYFAREDQQFKIEDRTDLSLPTRNTNQQEGSQMATVTRSKSKTAAKSTAKSGTKAAPKAKSNGEAKGGGRPRVTFTQAQLEKSAKMKREGKTWNQIRESLGVKTSSGQFQKLWDEAGIDRPATRERSAPGEGKAAQSDADDKGAKAAEARKGSGKKVTRRASKANPSK